MKSKTAFLSLLILILFTATATHAFNLPDTGQTKCYNTAGTEIPCAGTGQDGEYSINPMSFTDNGNGTVTDNNTELMWQKCSAGQNNDATCSGAAVTYNWYQASGTYDAMFNPSSQNVCGSLNLGGYSDWRLPTKKELISIVDYSILFPAINTTYFPNTMIHSTFYWSFTTDAYYPAWGVFFDDGYAHYKYSWVSPAYVRCVRGGQPSQSFTDNGNGMVTDNKTGLVWQQGEPGAMTWDSALSYCEGLSLGGNTDWRLPNIKELESITDDARYNPAIDITFFPGSYASYYWSSTTYDQADDRAWHVVFDGGSVNDRMKFESSYVRCVRGGQVGSFDYYCDGDNDGYISSSLSGTCQGTGCVPAGCQTTAGNDCNDNDPLVNPGATEICDGVDNDCDGSVDEGCNVDLYISSMSALSSATAGDTISVSDTTNKSGVSLVGATTTKIYFSKDNKYSSGDTEIGSRAVSAFGSGPGSSSGSTNVTIPTNACTQTYYLIARADANGNVSEWNEGNNNRAIAIGITNPIPRVDLYVSSVTAPSSANAGDTITVTDTTNKSGCAAGASTTKIYLSTDNKYSISDTYLGERAVGSFGAGAGNNSGSTNVTIPSGTPAGNYYVIVRADADKVITEWNEGNNNRAGAITINP